jgi:cystathionine beta-synthase
MTLPLPQPVGSSLGLIGHTPMIEVTRIDTGPCQLFLKLESWNPGGSIKDRIAVSMIEAAEAEGWLKPGGTIVEATAGNTGLALAQVGLLKGYQVLLVIPDKMAKEKIQHLRAMGADVRLTRSDVPRGHPGVLHGPRRDAGAADPRRLLRQPVRQPGEPRRARAHHRPGDLGATGGQGGRGGGRHRLRRHHHRRRPLPEGRNPDVQVVLADPVGSVLAGIATEGKPGPKGSYTVEGIGQDFVPDNADMKLVDRAYSISDREAIQTAARAAAEGRRAGRARRRDAGGGGAPLVPRADRAQARRHLRLRHRRALSVQGLQRQLAGRSGPADRPMHGDLSDLITAVLRGGTSPWARRHPADRLQPHAAADISQLPVMEGSRWSASSTTATSCTCWTPTSSAARRASAAGEQRHGHPARHPAAQRNPRRPDPIFDRDRVAILLDGDEFVGLITRVDLINYLRLHPEGSHSRLASRPPCRQGPRPAEQIHTHDGNARVSSGLEVYYPRLKGGSGRRRGRRLGGL